MDTTNKLVLIGNGFDLAHGLKTSYKDFLDWYISEAYTTYCKSNYPVFPFNRYDDALVKMNRKSSAIYVDPRMKIKTVEQVINGFIADHLYNPEHKFGRELVLEALNENNFQFLEIKSVFLLGLLNKFNEKNWVDIEREYFEILKKCFSGKNFKYSIKYIPELNKEFNFIIEKLTQYIISINQTIGNYPKLSPKNLESAFNHVFSVTANHPKIKFLNFNYTETLFEKGYADETDIIHVHGRAKDVVANPIIFGYGDETDPAYQNMEDSGENMYLEHIKSFGYFKTNNYTELISYIDSAPYTVYIVGHSCGLSDRVLLSEIFEHDNCKRIEVFFYKRRDGSNNFTEVTQEISRHFKPKNKGLMLRRLAPQSDGNYIPQN